MNAQLTKQNQRIIRFYNAESKRVEEREKIIHQLFSYFHQNNHMKRFSFSKEKAGKIFEKMVNILKDEYQVFRGLIHSKEEQELLPSFRIIETNQPEKFLNHLNTYSHRKVTCLAGETERVSLYRIEQEDWATLLHDEPIRIINGEPIGFADASFNPHGSYLLFGRTYEWIKESKDYAEKEIKRDIQQFSLLVYHPKQKKEHSFYQSKELQEQKPVGQLTKIEQFKRWSHPLRKYI